MKLIQSKLITQVICLKNPKFVAFYLQLFKKPLMMIDIKAILN